MPEANVVTSENVDAFYAQKMNLEQPAPAKEEVTDAPKESKPAEAPEANSESEEAEAQKEAAKQEERGKQKKEPNPKLQQRFSDLTKEREDAKREAAKERESREATERRLAELEAKLNPPKQTEEDAKPKAADFKDAFEFAEKLAEWSARNAIKEREKHESQRAIQQEREKVSKAWMSRQAEFESETPDYRDMIDSVDVKVSNEIRDAILESEAGPQILYHLASNPEIAKEWESKSDRAALIQLGKLEDRLMKKPSEKTEEKPKVEQKPESKPQVSKAPEPITPIKSAASSTDNLVDGNGEFKGTYAQFKELVKAGKIK